MFQKGTTDKIADDLLLSLCFKAILVHHLIDAQLHSGDLFFRVFRHLLLGVIVERNGSGSFLHHSPHRSIDGSFGCKDGFLQTHGVCCWLDFWIANAVVPLSQRFNHVWRILSVH